MSTDLASSLSSTRAAGSTASSARKRGHAKGSYQEFLKTKAKATADVGKVVTRSDVHELLHDWQAEIVKWAVGKGRAAIFADTGLGKTLMQLEWARLSGSTSLIVAPLAVCAQTVEEAKRIGIDVTYTRDGVHGQGVWITNYEMIDHVDPTMLDAIALDESSILKQSDGKTRKRLIEHFSKVPARLACTATPAPNDSEELTNQAEFLGITTRVNMLAAYFVHDQDGWRLKGHARGPMMRWMASWAVALRHPRDIGYETPGYDLPGLSIIPQVVDYEPDCDDALFAAGPGGVGGRAAMRKETLQVRCKRAAEIVAEEPDEPWIIWCGLNSEAELLERLIPESVNVHGAMSPEEKAEHFIGFASSRPKILITKPSMAAFGLNWQHCARIAFVGLSDSYEQYYQSIRRCYRYGQQRVVDAHIILTSAESAIASNVARKEREANDLHAQLVANMIAAGELKRES